jgi:hypothetical protein
VSLANLPDQKVVPINQPIILQFNRFLNPFTVTRQTIRLLDSSGAPFTDAVFDYDPVLLQVRLSNPGGGEMWLVEGQRYQVTMAAATPAMATGMGTGPSSGGVQAIDNATFSQMTTTIEFTAGPPGAPFVEPTMHFCADVWPFFKGPLIQPPPFVAGAPPPPSYYVAACQSPNCHGAPQSTMVTPRFPTGESEPAEGLVLDTPAYVAQTAIGKVANESNVGAMASSGAPGAIFGINMPIIDPGTSGTGDPANSWIMYKVLLGEPLPESMNQIPAVACNAFKTTTSYPAGVSPVITDAERARLSNFIPGREMPYPPPVDAGDMGDVLTIPPPGGLDDDALTLDQMERLRLWIRQGALFDEFPLPDGGSTQDCRSACLPPCSLSMAPCFDAGATDGGSMKDGTSESGATKDGSSDAGTKG